MVTWPSSLYTSQIPGGGHSQNANPTPLAKIAQGKLRIAQVPYTLVGTEAAADVIQLVQLKAGARVVADLCRVTSQNPGTTLTLNIGDASNASRYASGLTLGGAVNDKGFNSAPGTDAYVPTDITSVIPPASASDQTTVLATISAAAALTAGNKVLFLIAYVDE